MTKLLYRGVEYDAEQKPTQTLADQMRRKELIYRTVEHNGEFATEPTQKAYEHVYRGVRYA